jgi:hypothetical protein
MRMQRGRSDTRAGIQAAGILEQRAAISEAFRCGVHYKRLDIERLKHLSPAAVQLRVKRALSGARTNAGHDCRAFTESARRWMSFFLVRGGESCNKQVSGITRFTGDATL